MADIFVSYTSSDRDWANWIGLELEKLGHVAHVHEWEISAGGNIPAWMEARHNEADHVLFVISRLYLTKDYSNWERLSAEWAAVSKRRNFGLPVFVEECETPTLLAPLKRCDLYGLKEQDARARLLQYLKPAAKPTTAPFPGAGTPGSAAPAGAIPFPGGKFALSNIPISVPRYFLGRDGAFEAIEAALTRNEGRVSIAALYGLRGVGKSTLAAAYAERHRRDYRAAWWIRAQTEATIRADLIALGVPLGWVAADEKEEPALKVMRERVRDEGEGILLIYDNAIDAASLRSYLPSGGAARILLTSNAYAWRGVAEPVEIRVWPSDVGARYLIARAGRDEDRAEAEALSETLGGLPLAHEQAAAYCEELSVSFADYRKRFEAAPTDLLADVQFAVAEYHHGLTVAKSFALAIDEAAARHGAAESLIAHGALLAAEPIPLFLFSEALDKLGEPLSSQLANDGLDKAIGALRSFALVDCEMIADERDPATTTKTIRLHRLVRKVAAARCQGAAADAMKRVLVDAMAAVYPTNVFRDPTSWPRARRLDVLGMQLVGDGSAVPSGVELSASILLGGLGSYRHAALAAFSEARPLFERSLEVAELALGSWHLATATSLNNLALLLEDLGDLSGAGTLLKRAVTIWEKLLGSDHPHIATGQNNLGLRLHSQNQIGEAQLLIEQALATREKLLGPQHLDTAISVASLARLLQTQGDLSGARFHYTRALVTFEKQLGLEDVNTNRARSNLAGVRLSEGAASDAVALSQAALAGHDKVLGADHPWTKASARTTADALDALGRTDEATSVRAKYGLTGGPAA